MSEVRGDTMLDDEDDMVPSPEISYVSDTEPGISRRRSGRGFTYLYPDGTKVSDSAEIERIRKLVIPPAYSQVWISIDPNSHLQATGRDARGRKQYRYHPAWSASRDEAKFDTLFSFASALPKIRESIDRDLRLRKPGLDKVTASVVWLLDNLLIRVGNATYARDNGSYGLTTLRNKHLTIEGGTLHFHFKGKSGKEWKLRHNDRRITRAISSIQELPGQQLFQYLDDDGKRHAVTSNDVNAYIREASGDAFTSRQFRTWGATKHAATAFASLALPETKREKLLAVNSVIDQVAARLVNTRSVCRKSYIHPRVFTDFEAGLLADAMKKPPNDSAATDWFSDEEARVYAWLESTASGR